MKILIASDLHHEGGVDEYQPPSAGYDIAILAGDIDSLAGLGVKWAKDPKTFPCAKAVIYVPGNHEYYGTVMQPTVGHIREWAKGSVVHALDGDEVVVDGVRFLGCTLWTDFVMPVFVPEYHRVSDVAFSMQQARASLNDFHLILSEPSAHRFPDPDELNRELLAWEEVKADAAVLISEMRLGTLPPPGRSRVDPARLTHQQLGRWTLTPEETAAIHDEQRAWLQKKLAEPLPDGGGHPPRATPGFGGPTLRRERAVASVRERPAGGDVRGAGALGPWACAPQLRLPSREVPGCLQPTWPLPWLAGPSRSRERSLRSRVRGRDLRVASCLPTRISAHLPLHQSMEVSDDDA